jgi:hypothetical protein
MNAPTQELMTVWMSKIREVCEESPLAPIEDEKVIMAGE